MRTAVRDVSKLLPIKTWRLLLSQAAPLELHSQPRFVASRKLHSSVGTIPGRGEPASKILNLLALSRLYMLDRLLLGFPCGLSALLAPLALCGEFRTSPANTEIVRDGYSMPSD